MFRLQSKENQETQGYQTVGVDMVVTSERAILLDVQVWAGPVLSRGKRCPPPPPPPPAHS